METCLQVSFFKPSIFLDKSLSKERTGYDIIMKIWGHFVKNDDKQKKDNTLTQAVLKLDTKSGLLGNLVK